MYYIMHVLVLKVLFTPYCRRLCRISVSVQPEALWEHTKSRWVTIRMRKKPRVTNTRLPYRSQEHKSIAQVWQCWYLWIYTLFEGENRKHTKHCAWPQAKTRVFLQSFHCPKMRCQIETLLYINIEKTMSFKLKPVMIFTSVVNNI